MLQIVVNIVDISQTTQIYIYTLNCDNYYAERTLNRFVCAIWSDNGKAEKKSHFFVVFTFVRDAGRKSDPYLNIVNN